MEHEKLTPAEKVRRQVAQKNGNLMDAEARQQIQNWIDSPEKDYFQGVTIFGRYSRNKGLFYQFNRKQQPEYLLHELTRILAGSSPLIATRGAAEPINQNPQQRTIIDAENKIKRSDLPQPLQNLYDDNTEDYKLMRAVHEKMKQAQTDQERAKFRAELSVFDVAIANRWQIIDSWIKNGNLTGITPKNEGGSGELDAKTVSNYRTYIKRGIDTLTDGKITDIKKLDELKEKIKQRYNDMVLSGNNFAPETTEKLKELGIIG